MIRGALREGGALRGALEAVAALTVAALIMVVLALLLDLAGASSAASYEAAGVTPYAVLCDRQGGQACDVAASLARWSWLVAR